MAKQTKKLRIYSNIINSGGINLHFPCLIMKANYDEYRDKVDMLTYIELRNKYGVWASNQDKYVPHIRDFNSMDSEYEEIKLSEFLSCSVNFSYIYKLKDTRGRL